MTEDLPLAVTLRRMTTANWTSQVIHDIAMLGIPDLLADGPKTAEALASSTSTHAPSLYRLLRAVASLGIFEEDDARQFSLTPLGVLLRSDAEHSMRAWSIQVSEPWYRACWDKLLHSVRTGQAAFPDVHGVGMWEYLERDEDAAAQFNGAMTSVAPIKAKATVAAYDFSGFATVVDVGGGHGTLLTAILAAHPATRGILFDLPQVVAGAGEILRERGVEDRCAVVGGSFFDSVPSGGDAYVLQTVIHDWDDERSIAILMNCRRVMGPQAKLLLVEQVVPTGNSFHPSKFDDLNMLVSLGGRERTAKEFRALVAAAGFTLTGISPTASQWSVVEAVPA